MFDTATRNLEAARWAPFKHQVTFEGLDFTGATFAMQVRDRKDGGVLRANLSTTATAGAEGIRFVSYSGDDTQIEIVIAEVTMEAMATVESTGTIGDDGRAWYDLHITPSGGTKFVAMAGMFKIKAGATNNG